MRSVGVFERAYIGAGGTGRNTTVLRANYKMPESVEFFRESFRLYSTLSQELDYNLLFSTRGLFWLAHSEGSLRLQRERAMLNQALGVDTIFITPRGGRRSCAPRSTSPPAARDTRSSGASYHPPGSVIRHDAVVWGYAAAAERLGVDDPRGDRGHRRSGSSDGRCVGIETPQGFVAAGTVVSAVGGLHERASPALAGVRLPVTTIRCRRSSPRPTSRSSTGSSPRPTCSSTSPRPRAASCSWAPRSSATRPTRRARRSRSSDECASRCVDLLPFIGQAADPAPVDGPVRHEPRLLADHGPDRGRGLPRLDRLGHLGLQGDPGLRHRRWPSSSRRGKVPSLIAPFRVDRFRDDRLVADRSSAGTH